MSIRPDSSQFKILVFHVNFTNSSKLTVRLLDGNFDAGRMYSLNLKINTESYLGVKLDVIEDTGLGQVESHFDNPNPFYKNNL